jgi:hypothetical protein
MSICEKFVIIIAFLADLVYFNDIKIVKCIIIMMLVV